MVTLNGRQMPTHSGTSRAYDFADIASEGISAVVVNKTGDATAPSGGIGSTINIITTKPLEAGTVRSIGVKAVIDTSVETGDEISPEIAGLFSETFADDTVGISLSFSAQERNNAERFANVGGWRSQFATADAARYGTDWDTPGELTRHINRPFSANYADDQLADAIAGVQANDKLDDTQKQDEIKALEDERARHPVNDVNMHFGARDKDGNIIRDLDGNIIPCDVNTKRCEHGSISLPQSVGYNLTEYSSTRLNGQLTMQWRPTDSVTYTVDYTYSELDVENSYNDQSAWFAHQGAVEQISQWDNAPISTPLVYRELANNSDFAMGLGIQGFTNENESLGFNLDLFVNDRLRLNFDAHTSEARSGANTDYGTSSLITMASFNRTVSKVYFTEDLPILELGLDSELDETTGELINPNTANESDDPNYQGRILYPNDMILTGSVFSNGKALMEIDQFRLTGTYDISDISSIDFGVETSKVSNKSVSSNVQRDTWGGISNPADLAHLFIDDNNTPDDSDDDKIIYSDMSMNFENISGGDSELRQSQSFWADFDGIVDTARTLPADYWTNKVDMQGTCDVDDPEFTQDFDGEEVKTNWYCAADGDKEAGHWDTDLRTTETTNAVFMQYSQEDDFTSVRAGFRWEQTEVESTALTPKYIRTQWTGGNEFSLIQDEDEDGNGVRVFVPQTGKYNLFLPNLDIKMNFTDDFIGRISASKTVTRPNYDAIKGGVTAATTYRVGNNNGNISANRGAPDLDPITSKNLDISAEWYYDDASYLSVGWFKKQTSNFIAQKTSKEPVPLDAFPGLTAVTSGGAWDQAYRVANAANNDIALSDDKDIKPYLPEEPTIENPLVSVNEDDVAADQALPEDQQQGLVANDIQTFKLSYPFNDKDADVYGWEFNIQHNFGESGFGFIANYTNAWSDVNYVNTPTTDPCLQESICYLIPQFALSGLSDSANFIAFYDKDGLNARIAYNWRDDFFAGDGQSQGAFYDDNGNQIGQNPTFVKDYAQVDMSASYEFSDNLTVFIDGINITDEGYKNYGRTERQALRVGNTGPRYNVGFRYNF
jgi:TonB-dependent receptor